MQAGLERRKNTGGVDKCNTGNYTEERRPDEMQHYRTIALLNHMNRVLMKVLQVRLRAQTDTYITDEQAGFRRD